MFALLVALPVSDARFPDRLPCWHPSPALLPRRLVSLDRRLHAGLVELTCASTRPGYMNYGSFGHIASHELTVR